MIGADIDLFEATDNDFYIKLAAEAANYIIVLMEDKDQGGFYDLAPNPNALGELARPKKEISDNADAALVLLRLAALTKGSAAAFSAKLGGEGDFRQAAERALKAFASEYSGYSYFASSYARAVVALETALHIVIVGDRNDARTLALQRAAWQIAVPGKAVERLDAETGKSRNYPIGNDGSPRAYVCLGTQCQVIATPEELPPILRSSDIAG